MSTETPKTVHRAKQGTEFDRLNRITQEAVTLAQEATLSAFAWKLAYTHGVPESDLELLHTATDVDTMTRVAMLAGTKHP